MSEYPSDWKLIPIREIITESRINPELDDPSKRISVKLHCEGVEKRSERATDQAGATRYYKRLAGQFIYGKQNLHKGAVGIVPEELDGFCSSQDIPAFDITPSVDPNWFLHLFRQRNFYESLENIATGTGSKRIQPSELGEKEIAVPPLPEQKKIAEILSGIEGVIHRRRSLLEKVTLLASRSFNEVIDKIATEHPIATVESVTTKVIDGPHLTPNYQERGVPFVTVKNISSGKLDLTNTKFITADDHADFCMRGKAEHGDILYSKDGSIGHTCVVPKEYDFSFFVSVALLKTNKELIYPEYLNAVLQSTLIKTQTELMSEGSGLKHMVLRSIKALKIPLPPLDEQIRLMAQLLPVFKSREIIEETIQRMAYFREGIASDLLSGRKRVSV
jgi:type I restriction enzyme S subunit